MAFAPPPHSYQAVIEVTKSNSDFLWQGSAMEGMYCAVVLLAYIQADLSVSIAAPACLQWSLISSNGLLLYL